MKVTAPAAELVGGYEALRAQALGELPPFTPQGLSVFMRCGLAGWMSACPPREPAQPTPGALGGLTRPRETGGPAAVSAELVTMLAEMALRSHRRYSL